VKKVKITLHGRIVYEAHRTFEIEVPDDENVQPLRYEYHQRSC